MIDAHDQGMSAAALSISRNMIRDRWGVE